MPEIRKEADCACAAKDKTERLGGCGPCLATHVGRLGQGLCLIFDPHHAVRQVTNAYPGFVFQEW